MKMIYFYFLTVGVGTKGLESSGYKTSGFPLQRIQLYIIMSKPYTIKSITSLDTLQVLLRIQVVSSCIGHN